MLNILNLVNVGKEVNKVYYILFFRACCTHIIANMCQKVNNLIAAKACQDEAKRGKGLQKPNFKKILWLQSQQENAENEVIKVNNCLQNIVKCSIINLLELPFFITLLLII